MTFTHKKGSKTWIDLDGGAPKEIRGISKELRAINSSMLAAKQNEIIKQMTVLGFVILPLNLIVWIFTMRVEGLPFIEHPQGFYIVSALMLASAVTALIYVKHRKWL